MPDTVYLSFPSALQRESLFPAIQSLLQHPVQEEILVRIFTDRYGDRDSNQSSVPAFVTDGVADLQKQGVNIVLQTLKERNELIKELSSSFDKELLAYALLPPSEGKSFGANVNMSMLDSSGHILVSTDDDIIAQPARIKPALLDSIASNAQTTPNDYQKGDDTRTLLYFKDRASVLDAVETVELNILEQYLDLFSQNEQLLWINPGLYGDTGMGSARGVLSLTGLSRAFLHRDYENLKLSREAVSIHLKTEISPKTMLMGTQTAFYNKVPLVPFMPYGRNSDGLSGLLNRLIYPDSVSGYTDFAVYHASDPNRTNPPASLTALTPSLSDLAMNIAIAYRGENVPDGFAYYGDLFSTMARLKNADFVEVYHNAFSLLYTTFCDHLEALLDRYNEQPPDWADDVKAHIDNIQQKMLNPLSLFGPDGNGLSIERTKYHLEMYGELLKIWPDLWVFCA